MYNTVMSIQNNHNTASLKLNGENGRIIVHSSEDHSSFSNRPFAEKAIFERYDSPMRVQIGRMDESQGVELAEGTTYYRERFLWTRNNVTADIGDGRPGVWVLGFTSIQRGSFEDVLHEALENGKSFAQAAASHMDIFAVLADEEHKSILTISRWASVGRFLETVHTAAKEKMPAARLIKKITLARFNQYLTTTGLLSGIQSVYHPYKLVRNQVSSE